jgi:hypothetical protein
MQKINSLIIILFIGFTLSFGQNLNKVETTVKSIQFDTSLKRKISTTNDTLKKVKQVYVNNNEKKLNSYFTEWEKGFMSGLIATVIGFILTMLWDIYKNNRDKTEKDNIIKKLIKDTLNENLGYIVDINSVLTHELTVLSQSQTVVKNITTLKNDFWDLIKFNIPKNLLTNNNLLQKLQDISSLTKSINENINSREMYRLNNGAMDNYSTILRYYDELILAENEKLIGKIAIFKTDYK